MSACLTERVADKLIKSSNSCQVKRLKSVLVIQVHSEAILPRNFKSSYSSAVEFSNSAF